MGFCWLVGCLLAWIVGFLGVVVGREQTLGV